jgi:hypothetical protein
MYVTKPTSVSLTVEWWRAQLGNKIINFTKWDPIESLFTFLFSTHEMGLNWNAASLWILEESHAAMLVQAILKVQDWCISKVAVSILAYDLFHAIQEYVYA